MAEKPRIKEKDEILGSLGKKRAPSVVQSDVLPPPIEHIDLPAQDGEESHAKRRGRPRKHPEQADTGQRARTENPAPAEPAPVEMPDQHPLDFSKYELPQQKEKRRGRPRKGEPRAWMPPELEDAPPLEQYAAPRDELKFTIPNPPVSAWAPPPAPQEEKPAKKPILRAGEVQAQTFAYSDLEVEQRKESEAQARLKEQRIQRELGRVEQRERAVIEQLHREAEEKAERKRKQAEEQAAQEQQQAEAEAERLNREAEIQAENKRRAAEEEAERARQEAESKRRAAEEEAEKARQEAERKRREIEEEAEREQRRAEEEAARLRREAERRAAMLKQQADEEAEQLRQEAEHKVERIRWEKESRRKLLEDVQYRDNVLEQLGDAFEERFIQKFDDDGTQPAAEAETPWWLAERREGMSKRPVRETDRYPENSFADTTGMAFSPPDPSEEVPPPEELPLWQPEELENTQDTIEELINSPDDTLEILPAQEQEVEQEADQFLRDFVEGVRREEGNNAPTEAPPENVAETPPPTPEETFQDALAEKFMREREQYLQELGIAGQMEAAQPAEAQQPVQESETEQEKEKPAAAVAYPHRKLDFQIRPEMHLQPGETPAAAPSAKPAEAKPVTYNRAAQIRPQAASVDMVDDAPGDVIAPEEPAQPSGPKTAEQLLLELGEQNRRRSMDKSKKRSQKQFKFRFTSVQGGEEGESSGFRFPNPFANMTATGKMVTVAAGVGILVVTMLAWGILQMLAPLEESISEEGPGLFSADDESLLTRYESYNPEKMVTYSDVSIKRSGLTVSNLTVRNRFVIEEDAKAEGSMTLDNVVVGDYIYVRTSGVNRLDLRNVQAERVIINNTSTEVAIVASGNTDIGAVEIRTPVTIEQGELLVEAAGIRSVQVMNDTAAEPLTVAVDKAALSGFSTQGAAQLDFTEATVETLSADGDLTLSGSGRVEELNFGLNLGGGAENDHSPMALPASLLVKGVEVGHLNLKSAANLNLSAEADTVYIADPVVLGGNGTMGHLIINEKFGNARLPVDIYGVSIQQLTANAEALIYANDSAMINTLTANASVWALGNKVNLLKANADNVIYEHEPDNMLVAQGVDPPQSKEDNPNLNYDLNYDFAADSGEPSIDATADAVSTTCDHSREVGGFVLGDGSRTNPFVVETAAQLAHVAEHLDSYFMQVSDIDIAEDSEYASGFLTIGGYDEQFTGVYDGAGFVIENLRIYGDDEHIGLFAENAGTIRNVHIDSGEIDAGSDSFVGAVAGTNYQNGVVENCSNGAAVSASSSTYAGGIVGYNYGGKIIDCYNTARIDGGGENSSTGGIAGMNRQDASITNCYNVGVINSTGLFGAVAGSNEAVITNCYYLENGDLTGIGNGDGVALSRTASDMASAQMAALLAAGNDDSLWQTGGANNYAYPTHRQPGSASTAMDAAANLPEDDGLDSIDDSDDIASDIDAENEGFDIDAGDDDMGADVVEDDAAAGDDEWADADLDAPTGQEAPVQGIATYEE